MVSTPWSIYKNNFFVFLTLVTDFKYILAVFSQPWLSRSFQSTPDGCIEQYPYFTWGGGLFDPLYHESVYHIYRTRTRFTKIRDFVPFGICQDPVKQLLTFFFQKILKFLKSKFFWGPQALGKY